MDAHADLGDRSSRGTRRPDGFLERGQQVTRLEAFVDAAFAFAVTLLIVSFDDYPRTYSELVIALKGTPAFAASFALVAIFWYGHHTWSRRYGLDDGRSVFLSLVLVFLVLIWVFPLRMMFSLAFAWLSTLVLPEAWRLPFHGWLEAGSDVLNLFLVYAVAWSSLGIVIALLNRQAWRQRDALGLDLEERVATRGEIARWLWVPATGVISAGVALSIPPDAPDWLYGAPGMTYGLMWLTGVMGSLAERRWRPRIEAELLLDATAAAISADEIEEREA